MTELEKIAYAKSFIDKLANGINPIDDSIIPDGDTVNNLRLSRCFFYVSDILRRVIENGGVAPSVQLKEKKRKNQPYFLLPEQASAFAFSELPITVTEIINRIIAVGPQEGVKRFPRKNLTAWLVSLGLLEELEINGSRTKRPTPRGKEMGIFQEERQGKRGSYCVVLYTTDAQHFIIDNIEAVLAFNIDEQKAQADYTARDKAEAAAENEATAEAQKYDNPPFSYAQKPMITCQSCRFARNGECFPQKEICPDYEKAYDVPQNEKEAWPEMGDASYLKQKGRYRK